ncbi:MliC family protein (plasmid) [Burkholderia vietnamiensis]|uniref:MliC family protein n=1 Tax=Burkholderia vietnamiensis TaxID=60552 RepID=UPI00201843CB|nr:MliC family protein [Burkholderia vietnamiensis]MCO1348845.1 MliC family protein [Burkholderia vietnamiensis]MCO1431317.1 MliC family protein [Burkholderia vietnamiensis]UQN45682.1 MliC family protein [Burkholderia vietnamiensis]
MIRQTFIALALAGAAVSAASAAHAAQLTVEEIDADARQPTVYQCANEKQPLRVSYWRAGNGQSFALVPVNGQQMLFVDTVSASGVRYQAGRYTWWTKGREATLRDEIADPNAAPMLGDCVQVDKKKKKKG